MLNFFRGRPCLFTVALLGLAFFFLHFSYTEPDKEVTAIARTSAVEFLQSTASLQNAAEDFKFGRTSLKALKEEFIATRKAYKKIEFLLDYFYPRYVEEHINGAPLLHIERYDTRPIVLPPEGLQVLDELIFSEEVEEQNAEVAMLTQQLYNHVKVLVNGFKQRKINEEEIIEAVRGGLVRSFTMGVTGFDTPGSLNALEEAAVSLLSLKEACAPFLSIVYPEKAGEINEQFEYGINLLHTSNFEEFDRLGFLKECINPLYTNLLHIKKDLKLTADEGLVSARNQQGANLFADDFLDPYFFTELNKIEDSKKLRLLGQKLFYDTRLSGNGQMSCATCHHPAKAFTDGKKKSASNVVGETVERNSPTLLNAVYADRYFYDLRAYTLEQQAEHVIFNHNEFNTAYEEIIEKLNKDEDYQKQFKDALGERKISRTAFSKALASYVLSLRSFNSEFDKYVRGDIEHLDPKVKHGFNLFMGKAACATCHFPPTFSGLVPPGYTKNESEILGVLETPGLWQKKLDPDPGRIANKIYSEEAWIFERSFKTPTVRNVELTSPYFHNGAYATLEEVINFYDHGGGLGLGMEVTNQTLPGDSLHLSAEEKKALIAFMKSLTDTSGFKDTAVSPL